MASKKASLDHLRNISLFSSFSTKDLQKIAKAGDEIAMPAGSLIVDQGQTGREAFVVLEGTVVVRRNGKKVATLGPGTIVGELSLLDHGPRTATVICETDCTLMLITQRHFSAMLDDVPALSHKLLASLAGRIREHDRTYYG
ncbi:MAG: cyclic nucleotide-binding domain-containing protein [Ilumatobacteraceae bacterium]